jgi:hypothetical protein
MAVCPAGEDVLGPYLASKKHFVDEVVRPLQSKEEPLYVVPGSDAEAHARKRYPHKTIRHVRGSLRPRNVKTFLQGMHASFQRHAASGLDAVYHFTFTGREPAETTITIRYGKLAVDEGHHGTPNLRVVADSDTWLGFLAKERSLPWALLTRRIKLRGNPKWLLAFGRCFPS